MTRAEALERNIRRLLASTVEPPASTRKRVELPPRGRRESEAKRRARALRRHPIETEGMDALNRRCLGS
jgi:plasmid stabilization system protein ParE